MLTLACGVLFKRIVVWKLTRVCLCLSVCVRARFLLALLSPRGMDVVFTDYVHGDLTKPLSKFLNAVVHVGAVCVFSLCLCGG